MGTAFWQEVNIHMDGHIDGLQFPGASDFSESEGCRPVSVSGISLRNRYEIFLLLLLQQSSWYVIPTFDPTRGESEHCMCTHIPCTNTSCIEGSLYRR